MTDADVKKIVAKILRERFPGFKRSSVRSEEDFDGTSILRIVMEVRENEVSSDRLTDALHEIRSKLLRNGEERFVFLSSESPQNEMVEEDVE